MPAPSGIAEPRSPTRAQTVACNNSPSDAAILNAAIETSALGSEIVISGPCLLNETIVLRGERAYRGESPATVLRQADGANLTALLASDAFVDNADFTGTPVAVRHLTLDGNRVNNVGAVTDGIVLRSWLSIVEGVHIQDMGGHGMRITSVGIEGAPLLTTQVNGQITGNFVTDSGAHGIFVEDPQNAVTDWTLTNNWIANSGDDGIHLDNTAGWIIARNHVYGVPHDAIDARRLFGSTISDNYIEGFGETSDTGTWRGIHATVQGDATSTITSNRIHNFGLGTSRARSADSAYHYLNVTTNYDTGVVSVTGNTIRGGATGDETGLRYTAPEGTRLFATSTGNAVGNVATRRHVGDRVRVTSGL